MVFHVFVVVDGTTDSQSESREESGLCAPAQLEAQYAYNTKFFHLVFSSGLKQSMVYNIAQTMDDKQVGFLNSAGFFAGHTNFRVTGSEYR